MNWGSSTYKDATLYCWVKVQRGMPHNYLQPYISRICACVSVLTWRCGFVDDTTQSSIPPEASSHERNADVIVYYEFTPVLTLIIIMTSRVSDKVQEGSMQ